MLAIFWSRWQFLVLLLEGQSSFPYPRPRLGHFSRTILVAHNYVKYCSGWIKRHLGNFSKLFTYSGRWVGPILDYKQFHSKANDVSSFFIFEESFGTAAQSWSSIGFQLPKCPQWVFPLDLQMFNFCLIFFQPICIEHLNVQMFIKLILFHFANVQKLNEFFYSASGSTGGGGGVFSGSFQQKP